MPCSGLLAIAVDKNIPLIPTIEAFAKSCTGAMNIRARKLAKLLDHGIPLPEALDYIPGHPACKKFAHDSDWI